MNIICIYSVHNMSSFFNEGHKVIAISLPFSSPHFLKKNLITDFLTIEQDEVKYSQRRL